MFETKQSVKIEKSQSSFTWRLMKGGCYIGPVALFAVNVPIIIKWYTVAAIQKSCKHGK